MSNFVIEPTNNCDKVIKIHLEKELDYGKIYSRCSNKRAWRNRQDTYSLKNNDINCAEMNNITSSAEEIVLREVVLYD